MAQELFLFLEIVSKYANRTTNLKQFIVFKKEDLLKNFPFHDQRI